jgi:hypothetical protein
MSQFGKEAEERLLQSVRDVQSYIVDGDTPDDAIVKVARERRLHPDMLPLLVQATNVGRQGYQREKCSGQGVLCQIAEFPLARIENVKAALYPAKPAAPSAVLKAATVSKEYSQPPKPVPVYEKAAMEKVASAKLPDSYFQQPTPGYQGDPKTNVMRMQSQKMAVQQEISNAKVAEITARDQFLTAMGRVASYFKTASHDRLPLAEVEWNARRIFGPLATDVFNYVSTRTKEARASDPPRVARPVDVAAEPYVSIKAAIENAVKYADARQAVKDLEAGAAEKIAEITRPFYDRHTTGTTRVLGAVSSTYSPVKVGSLLTSVAAGMGANLGAGMRSAVSPKPTTDLISDIGLELDDPQHNDELKAIESKGMLNDFMANDEVIAGFDPQEVAEAYNEIVQLAPSSAAQPAIMRPLLRKRLSAGAVEPFEAQQMADIEKTVRQTAQVGRQGGQNVSPVLV